MKVIYNRKQVEAVHTWPLETNYKKLCCKMVSLCRELCSSFHPPTLYSEFIIVGDVH